MTKITYQINPSTEPTESAASTSTEAISGEIVWAASEYFGELSGRTYSLGEMEAVKIDQLPNLSPVAKLLLSAVAGAIIQHLLDQGVPADQIFSAGTFQISE